MFNIWTHILNRTPKFSSNGLNKTFNLTCSENSRTYLNLVTSPKKLKKNKLKWVLSYRVDLKLCMFNLILIITKTWNDDFFCLILELLEFHKFLSKAFCVIAILGFLPYKLRIDFKDLISVLEKGFWAQNT